MVTMIFMEVVISRSVERQAERVTVSLSFLSDLEYYTILEVCI